MKRILQNFLRWLGVSLTEDTITPLIFKQLLKSMATIQEQLATVEANQIKERAAHAEAYSEIRDAIAAFKAQLVEQANQIALLKTQIEEGTIGAAAIETLNRVVANSQQNVEDAQALADVIPNPPVEPPADQPPVEPAP